MVPEKLPCPHCNGTGYMASGYHCTECKGQGHRRCACKQPAHFEIDSDPTCADCAGSDAPSLCSVCGDTAVAVVEELELCERCLDGAKARHYARREESTGNMARVA